MTFLHFTNPHDYSLWTLSSPLVECIAGFISSQSARLSNGGWESTIDLGGLTNYALEGSNSTNNGVCIFGTKCKCRRVGPSSRRSGARVAHLFFSDVTLNNILLFKETYEKSTASSSTDNTAEAHVSQQQFVNGKLRSRVVQLRKVVKNSEPDLHEQWVQVYRQEVQLWVPDTVSGKRMRVFGDIQTAIPMEHRISICKWLYEACKSANWSRSSFHFALVLFDKYTMEAPHRIQTCELGCFATACLFIASHVKEASPDDSIITLDRFRRLCPEVGTPAQIREAEAHIVDVLKGAFSYGGKTPFDLSIQSLTSIMHCPALKNAVRIMLMTDFDLVYFECLSTLAEYSLMMGLCLIVSPSLLIVAFSLCIVEAFAMALGSIMKSSSVEWRLAWDVLELKVHLARRMFALPGGYRCIHPLCVILAPSVAKALEAVMRLVAMDNHTILRGNISSCALNSIVFEALDTTLGKIEIRSALEKGLEQCRFIADNPLHGSKQGDKTLSVMAESSIEMSASPCHVGWNPTASTTSRSSSLKSGDLNSTTEEEIGGSSGSTSAAAPAKVVCRKSVPCTSTFLMEKRSAAQPSGRVTFKSDFQSSSSTTHTSERSSEGNENLNGGDDSNIRPATRQSSSFLQHHRLSISYHRDGVHHPSTLRDDDIIQQVMNKWEERAKLKASGGSVSKKAAVVSRKSCPAL